MEKILQKLVVLQAIDFQEANRPSLFFCDGSIVSFREDSPLLGPSSRGLAERVPGRLVGPEVKLCCLLGCAFTS